MRWQRILHILVAALSLFCLYRLTVTSARAGLSRLYSTLAIIGSDIAPANRAVEMSVGDPEAHYTRGLTLVNLGRLSEAVSELQLTTQLRPHHYYVWLDLGVTLERVGNDQQALIALKESIRLAPSFAQPHWQLGNALFGQGRYPEAFIEMRQSTDRNPNLFDAMLDLAWIGADGDAAGFENYAQPKTKLEIVKAVRFLATQGKGEEAVRLIQGAGARADEEQQNLMRRSVAELLAKDQFVAAYNIWTINHPTGPGGAVEHFINGSFAESIVRNDPGFGWQIFSAPNITPSIDASGPSSGSRSLRIEFTGETQAGSSVQQLILVRPTHSYNVRFKAKSEGLVSAGPPAVVVVDPMEKKMKTLGQSSAIGTGTTNWTSYEFSFSADASTVAVYVFVNRLPCSQSPCPVFGKLWLSDFSISEK